MRTNHSRVLNDLRSLNKLHNWPKAAHNAVKGNRFNVVKASTYDLEDPSKKGRKNAQIDEDHFGSDGCTDSGRHEHDQEFDAEITTAGANVDDIAVEI
ncbi:hypothetical protein Tco_1459314 [Tanacetum coccineum]